MSERDLWVTNELNDLRTRGVETWSQTQKVGEKEMSDEEARRKKEAEKAKLQKELVKAIEDAEGSDESEVSVEETDPTTPASVSRKERKREKKKKVRKVNHSESSDEGCTKFTLQARTKVPTLEKGMTYAKYKINVDMWENAMKGYMSEKNMGMTLLQSLMNEDNRGGIKEQAWKKLGRDKFSLDGLTPRRSHVRRGDHMYPRAITSCPGHALCLTCRVKCTCSGDHIRAWCQELQRFAWYCNSWNQARM